MRHPYDEEEEEDEEEPIAAPSIGRVRRGLRRTPNTIPYRGPEGIGVFGNKGLETRMRLQRTAPVKKLSYEGDPAHDVVDLPAELSKLNRKGKWKYMCTNANFFLKTRALMSIYAECLVEMMEEELQNRVDDPLEREHGLTHFKTQHRDDPYIDRECGLSKWSYGYGKGADQQSDQDSSESPSGRKRYREEEGESANTSGVSGVSGVSEDWQVVDFGPDGDRYTVERDAEDERRHQQGGRWDESNPERRRLGTFGAYVEESSADNQGDGQEGLLAELDFREIMRKNKIAQEMEADNLCVIEMMERIRNDIDHTLSRAYKATFTLACSIKTRDEQQDEMREIASSYRIMMNLLEENGVESFAKRPKKVSRNGTKVESFREKYHPESEKRHTRAVGGREAAAQGIRQHRQHVDRLRKVRENLPETKVIDWIYTLFESYLCTESNSIFTKDKTVEGLSFTREMEIVQYIKACSSKLWIISSRLWFLTRLDTWVSNTRKGEDFTTLMCLLQPARNMSSVNAYKETNLPEYHIDAASNPELLKTVTPDTYVRGGPVTERNTLSFYYHSIKLMYPQEVPEMLYRKGSCPLVNVTEPVMNYDLKTLMVAIYELNCCIKEIPYTYELKDYVDLLYARASAFGSFLYMEEDFLNAEGFASSVGFRAGGGDTARRKKRRPNRPPSEQMYSHVKLGFFEYCWDMLFPTIECMRVHQSIMRLCSHNVSTAEFRTFSTQGTCADPDSFFNRVVCGGGSTSSDGNEMLKRVFRTLQPRRAEEGVEDSEPSTNGYFYPDCGFPVSPEEYGWNPYSVIMENRVRVFCLTYTEGSRSQLITDPFRACLAQYHLLPGEVNRFRQKYTRSDTAPVNIINSMRPSYWSTIADVILDRPIAATILKNTYPSIQPDNRESAVSILSRTTDDKFRLQTLRETAVKEVLDKSKMSKENKAEEAERSMKSLLMERGISQEMKHLIKVMFQGRAELSSFGGKVSHGTKVSLDFLVSCCFETMCLERLKYVEFDAVTARSENVQKSVKEWQEAGKFNTGWRNISDDARESIRKQQTFQTYSYNVGYLNNPAFLRKHRIAINTGQDRVSCARKPISIQSLGGYSVVWMAGDIAFHCESFAESLYFLAVCTLRNCLYILTMESDGMWDVVFHDQPHRTRTRTHRSVDVFSMVDSAALQMIRQEDNLVVGWDLRSYSIEYTCACLLWAFEMKDLAKSVEKTLPQKYADLVEELTNWIDVLYAAFGMEETLQNSRIFARSGKRTVVATGTGACDMDVHHDHTADESPGGAETVVQVATSAHKDVVQVSI